MDLSNQILSDPVNKWIFTETKSEVYLVGGFIRDLLMDKISSDKDYAVKGDVEQISMEAAQRFNGTLVTLRKDLTYRIVLKDKNVLDFSYIEKNINMDLHLRDYTINAIAWAPETGLLDHTGGIQDLHKGLIRAISSRNILEDPLRIVRAYRMAAQLEFDIDETTRTYLRNYSSQIHKVSKERVTTDIFRMISSPISFKYIKLSLLDNVLHEVMGISQDILIKNIIGIKKLDAFWHGLNSNKHDNQIESRLRHLLNAEISQSLSAIGLLRLFILTMNPEGPTSTSCILPSTKIRKSIIRMREAYQLSRSRLTGSRLYEILRTAEGCEHEFMALISVLNDRNVDKYIKSADVYLQARNNPVLSGEEIQDILNISSGRQVGEVKEEIKRRQFSGKIKTKREAREWIISNLT